MSIFDNIKKDWIKIVDDKNNITIENYGYNTGVVEGTTGKHCVKCVVVNYCWFKNEEGKKPPYLTFTKMEMLNDIFKGITPGLYHPFCHCVEIPILPPTINIIQLIVLQGKIDWLILDKSSWIESLGYYNVLDFINVIKELVKKSYCSGNYKMRFYDKYGFRVSMYLDCPGANEKIGNIYKIISAWSIFPNGKLKCNTLVGGWQK